MTPNVIDGVAISKGILLEISQQISTLTSNFETNGEQLQNDSVKARQPHLAVIIVGERKDSLAYVKRKADTCKSVGIQSSTYNLPASTTEKGLLDLISKLNATDDVDGILVQVRM